MYFYVNIQKLSSRKVTLQKTGAVSARDKPKLLEAFVPELMSSEDSEDDGTFTIRPLSWRSSRVSELFFGLDDKYDKKRTRKSKVMMFKRMEGSLSDRPKPISGTVPSWCIKQ